MSVHANILGKHGDREMATWSMTYLGGIADRSQFDKDLAEEPFFGANRPR